jgi:hypothetical protein
MVKSTVSVPVINWTANEAELIWKLITKLEKPENSKVFIGKKDKNEVHLVNVIYTKQPSEYNRGLKGKSCKADGRGNPP